MRDVEDLHLSRDAVAAARTAAWAERRKRTNLRSSPSTLQGHVRVAALTTLEHSSSTPPAPLDCLELAAPSLCIERLAPELGSELARDASSGRP